MQFRNLKDFYSAKVPADLAPGNIGTAKELMWDFEYTVNFDFGTDPTIDDLREIQKSSFQNGAPYAFAVWGIVRKHWDDQQGDTAGESLPLMMTIRSAQSTRQYTPEPVDIHTLGKFGNPTILPVPIILAPNGRLDIELFLAPEQPDIVGFNYEGESKHSITFLGSKLYYGAPQRMIFGPMMR